MSSVGVIDCSLVAGDSGGFSGALSVGSAGGVCSGGFSATIACLTTGPLKWSNYIPIAKRKENLYIDLVD